MPADIIEIARLEPVCGTRLGEEGTKPRALRLPRANPDVHVVALREDPAVTARHSSELDDNAMRIAAAGDPPIRDVAFERNTMDDAASESQRAGGGPIRPVRTDDHVHLDAPTVDSHGFTERDLRALAHLDALRLGRVEEEGIQAAALSHPDHGRASVPHHEIAIAEPELDDVHLLLDNRGGIDRAVL